ncbi:MAG: hypothetical protein N2559_08910 [Anaerolineae bacterium]|nr:hypothetical protein [Anaerolineae bacterium]
MLQITISKPLHHILARLTGEHRTDVALELATKDLLRLKLKEVEERIRDFESRYGMQFTEFKQAWNADTIPNKYSYEVEHDYWEWETAVEDEKKYRQMLDELL